MSKYLVNGGVWTLQAQTLVPTISFPNCTPGVTNEGMFNDGMQMGWGVVAAMAAAVSVLFVKKALHL